MLDELPFVIIREIIKRIIEYESIDNLMKLNKRFKNLIINDKVCQEHYLFIKYNLIIEKDHLKLIRLLNSKSYSKYIRKESPKNDNFATFVRPKDDKFIIVYKHPQTDGSVKRTFKFSQNTVIPTLLKIIDEKIEDFEDILMSNEFFYLKIDIKGCYFEKSWGRGEYALTSPWLFINPLTKNVMSEMEQYRFNFDSKILEIINEL